jgi:hypothetical protein
LQNLGYLRQQKAVSKQACESDKRMLMYWRG